MEADRELQATSENREFYLRRNAAGNGSNRVFACRFCRIVPGSCKKRFSLLGVSKGGKSFWTRFDTVSTRISGNVVSIWVNPRSWEEYPPAHSNLGVLPDRAKLEHIVRDFLAFVGNIRQILPTVDTLGLREGRPWVAHLHYFHACETILSGLKIQNFPAKYGTHRRLVLCGPTLTVSSLFIRPVGICYRASGSAARNRRSALSLSASENPYQERISSSFTGTSRVLLCWCVSTK